MQIRCTPGVNVFSLLLSNLHESIARAFSKCCLERAGIFLEWSVVHVWDACISISSFSAVAMKSITLEWTAQNAHNFSLFMLHWQPSFCWFFINCTKTELRFLLVSCFQQSFMLSFVCPTNLTVYKDEKQYLLLRFSDTAPHSGGNC